MLGPDVEIAVTAHDETNTRIRPERIVAALARAGERGVVLLVGVQSNQFPERSTSRRSSGSAGCRS